LLCSLTQMQASGWLTIKVTNLKDSSPLGKCTRIHLELGVNYSPPPQSSATL
jgi:hypothetical protein